jgi:FkbM family methyltransferase
MSSLARHLNPTRWPRYAAKLNVQTWRRLMFRLRVNYGAPVTTARVQGFSLAFDVRCSGMAESLFVHRTYEPTETRAFLDALRPGMVVCDIGANLGYYSLLASRAVGPSGKVIAVEPDPDNLRLLERNLRTNQATNVVIRGCAVGATRGTAVLHKSPENRGDHRLYSNGEAARTSVTVPVWTVDEICAEEGVSELQCVKMDVQGYEPFVLRGMEQVLARSPSVTLLTEFWPMGMEQAGGSSRDFFQWFEQHGFSAYVLNRDGMGAPVSYDGAIAALPEFDPLEPDGRFVNLLLRKRTRDEMPQA